MVIYLTPWFPRLTGGAFDNDPVNIL